MIILLQQNSIAIIINLPLSLAINFGTTGLKSHPLHPFTLLRLFVRQTSASQNLHTTNPYLDA